MLFPALPAASEDVLSLMSQAARGAAKVGNVIACFALVTATLHIFADTISTKFFSAPFNNTHTFVTRYYMVSLVFLALANAELRDSHIKADLFYSILSDRMKRLSHGLNLFLLAGFTLVLTWQVLIKAIAQTQRGEKRTVAGVEYLYWPSRWIVVVGMVAFCLVAIFKLVEFFARREKQGEAHEEGTSNE